jgi:glycerol-1-phosphate dehydrogenase [NAD(P)+]
MAGGKIQDISNARTVKAESMEKAYLESLAKRIDADLIIGMGGGRSIDVAKYIAHLSGKQWIAFPTILSHDGVVSSRASLENNGMKISVEAKEPIAIIADLDIIKSAPYRWIASGAGDVLSNMSAVEDWKIASLAGKEEYHTVMAELSLLGVRSVVENIEDIRKMSYHGLEMLLWGLICSGFAMNIYGSSRPCSGSEHNFSHALEKLGSKALHGEQCALGTLLMMKLQGKNPAEVRSHMKKLGLPTTAKDIGIEKNILVKALVMAKEIRNRYTVLDKKKITPKIAENLLKDVKIIP